jgi:hypothetical protein
MKDRNWTKTEPIIKALMEVPNSFCPIIKGVTKDIVGVYVSIPNSQPIPAGWKQVHSSLYTYPSNWIRIQKEFTNE